MRRLLALFSFLGLAGAAWIGAGGGTAGAEEWSEIVPGVWRTAGEPAGYALRDGDAALLIDAPQDGTGLRAHGARRVEGVLLTHHHRDGCAAVGTLLARKVPVRAPRPSAECLMPRDVRKYWQEAIPLRSSRTAYLVVPEGLAGIDCSLRDGQEIRWRGWQVRVVATPGHSPDHVAYAVRKGADGPLLLFCGDALAAPGKLWTPYSTDWDHWTDAGLTPAARSLRKLAALKPTVVLPAHGEPIRRAAAEALRQTAAAVEEVAFLKSYERYTKERLGKAPAYRFLAKEQAGSNGSLPWSRVSANLYYTGNTWVLVSRDNAFLVVDPWGKRSAEQIARLQRDRQLGKLEVVLFSHAHYDHYDGVYDLPGRDRFEVWMLDRAATPVADPYRLRAPFLDPRPVRIDRKPRDGETLTWREYRFRFHHLPGQTEYTMGVETTIDGKRCLFTADNWFHQDLYSGTGGWMGLNRSFPTTYLASARKVLDLRPEWVLAEHGGAFEFSPEDWRRRVAWASTSARAADAVCPSGHHLHDWDPSGVHVEPLVHKAGPGATLKATLVAANVLAHRQRLSATLQGRGLCQDQAWQLDLPAGGTVRQPMTIELGPNVRPGRNVLTVRVLAGRQPHLADTFLVIDAPP